MKLLLDTNVFLWASQEPELLSPAARSALTDPYNQRFLSIVSLWEMQVKHGLGKLPLPDVVDKIGPVWMRSLATELLTVELRHIGKLYELPQIHRDPFDRLLISKAICEDLTVVTSDESFNRYPVSVLW